GCPHRGHFNRVTSDAPTSQLRPPCQTDPPQDPVTGCLVTLLRGPGTRPAISLRMAYLPRRHPLQAHHHARQPRSHQLFESIATRRTGSTRPILYPFPVL